MLRKDISAALQHVCGRGTLESRLQVITARVPFNRVKRAEQFLREVLPVDFKIIVKPLSFLDHFTLWRVMWLDDVFHVEPPKPWPKYDVVLGVSNEPESGALFLQQFGRIKRPLLWKIKKNFLSIAIRLPILLIFIAGLVITATVLSVFFPSIQVGVWFMSGFIAHNIFSEPFFDVLFFRNRKPLQMDVTGWKELDTTWSGNFKELAERYYANIPTPTDHRKPPNPPPAPPIRRMKEGCEKPVNQAEIDEWNKKAKE